MFDFKNANDDQKKAIINTEGALLITAGPGTGKTFTLVNRAVYLIEKLKVDPSSIMVATFTDKASKELITRISNELLERNIIINLKDMYIGTFHSICLKILKEKSEYTNLRKNFTMMDAFDQQYFVYQNLYNFKQINNIELILGEVPVWSQSESLCKYINNLREELITSNELINSDDEEIKALGECISIYEKLMAERNSVDFTSIQTNVYDLLINNSDICKEYQEAIKYIMIDEYQDTNYIQEQLVFILGDKFKNICVVGDDDQGLYRFRGATIRNILEFPKKFEKHFCNRISLTKNYRSDSKIIDFYNNWMKTTDGKKFKFEWSNFRYDKKVEPINKSKMASDTVFKISGDDDADEWHESILQFIRNLQKTKTIKDYNQITFLSNSVKNKKVQALARYLEKNDIGVYSPRSDLFFEREEIRLVIGILLILFPNYIQRLDKKEIQWLPDRIYDYYEKSILIAVEWMKGDKHKQAIRWVREIGFNHSNLTKNTDYAFSGLLYEMFQFEPFKGYLSIDLNKGIIDQRQARNLALFSELLAKFEYAQNIILLTYKNMESIVDKFFNNYLRFLMDGGIGEYEDDSEYAPSGCISFLTIHQSKGMEFPIVIVDSLGSVPKHRNNGILDKVYNTYQRRKMFEPNESIKYFDFWRAYYTAFSRAQDMLILSCNEQKGIGATPSKYFKDHYDILTEYSPESIDLNEFKLHEIKDVNLKESYSFTSDITVYNNCSLQYKFFKELGFNPVRIGSTAFGMLVHQTIEDIHKVALRGESNKINESNIQTWFDVNYTSIVDNQHTYLGQGQLDAALRQVLRYVDRQNNSWTHVREAEVDVSLIKHNYILNGQIDLIQGNGNTIEIVDFKSEKKPDLIKGKSRIEHYKKQLQIYAHLVEEKTGTIVSKMNLYYTGAEDENPIISFSKNNQSINQTVKGFEEIVDKIQKHNYNTSSKDQLICSNCDMKHYCER